MAETDLITLSRARVQQALEALDVFANAIRVWPEETWAPHEFAAMDKGEAAITALRAALEQPEQEPARQRFDDTGGREEPDPVERLRFFCSLAMNKQDWLDVEAFFDDVLAERQKNAALEQPVQCMAHGECFGGQCIYTSRSGQPEQDTDCHAQGICQRSGYSIGQLEQDPDRWGAGYEAGYAAGMAEMKPEQAEPVAVFDEQQGSPVLLASAPMLSDGQSLYTRPPRREWRSLSEKEIGDVFHAARNAKLGAANDNSRHRLSVVEIARAVEAKLKEKNHE